MAANAPTEVVEALSTWAWEVGMVFQIADDALDLVADEETIGKPAGSDIREGTFTAPVLMAANGLQGDRIRSLLGDGMPYEDSVIAEVISIVREGGFIEKSLQTAEDRLDIANNALDDLPPVPARDILETLGTFLLSRVESARG
jgi:geranylgeranyl pyrophosphate synthase